MTRERTSEGEAQKVCGTLRNIIAMEETAGNAQCRVVGGGCVDVVRVEVRSRAVAAAAGRHAEAVHVPVVALRQKAVKRGWTR